MTPQDDDETVMDRLYRVIEQRRVERPTGSYTTKLFDDGRPRIAQKVGEEAVETVIAAMGGNKAETVTESADLIFHLLVLWSDLGIAPNEIWRELEGREKHGQTGD